MSNPIEYYPLTHPQKAIWYTEKLYPGTSIRNVAGTVKIKGEIDYSLLEKALNLFVEKNDAMRFRLVEEDGEPKQYISKYEYHKFDFIDFSGKEMQELYKWDEHLTHIPFNLTDSDLFYFAIIKISENEGGFYGKLHHLISDAWTMALLVNQVIEYYIQLKSGRDIIPGNKPSYVDFIFAEEEYKKSERFQKDREYWHNKLEAYTDLTTLKANAPKAMSKKARRKTLLVPKKLTARMQQYCAENKTSVYTLFLAALSMYINRTLSNEHIILGTTTLNRSNAKEKETTGMFSNIVSIQIDINQNMDFKTLTSLVLKETLSLLRHQKYPYDVLLKEVREKHKAVYDLFDIVLNYQNSRFNKDKYCEEYVARWHFNGYQTNSLIIHINDREDEGRLIINYDYLTGLFNAKELEFIHQHIINLLWHALDNPAKKISGLEMLSEKEKYRILNEFNDVKIVDSQGNTIHQLTEEQLEKNSEGKYYILDANLNLMPIGIAGDLYISVSDENMGKELLIQNPFAEGKLYKTGHIARWYPDGDIKLLDDMSKAKENEETRAVISATFTSEPIGDYIRWWGSKFGHNLKISFAGYNQVFQELLNPNSELSQNTDGVNIVLVRLEDFIRNDDGEEKTKISKLEQISDELKQAVDKFNNTALMITAIFPVSTHLNLSYAVKKKIKELNKKFEEYLSQRKNTYTINLNGIEELYSIEEVFDSIKDKEGHMPFTDEYYAAVGTVIARKICAIRKQHFKVIVLDCDNTLWRGICGEQGARDVKVEGAYKQLQEFMLEKYNQGMLLAICSKNNEEDIIEVFENNPQMVLNEKHISSWKVNWQEKSRNIKEIADELNLGIDSFIYIDDDPIECSKMIESCPEVLTFQLPEEEHIPLFLKHVWAFDRENITKEDTLRTSMYEAEQKRKELKEEGISLDHFLKNLKLKVSMREIKEGEIERAAQLTQRTNQFNLSTIRRTEQEIRGLAENEKIKCFVIEASDRFGDYGIIGLVVLEEDMEKLVIDTFLLSCRILGRRVEEVVLSGIRKYAYERGKDDIEATFIPTEKNRPIKEFLERLGWEKTEHHKGHTEYNLSIDALPEKIDYIEFYYNEMYEKNFEYIESIQTEIFALDHVAVAVKSMKEAEDYYKALGYSVANSVYDPLQNSYLSMCISDEYLPIELVAPADEKSPSYNITEACGEAPYHLCYRVSSIKRFLEKIQDIEYYIVSDEKPAILFNHQKVAFIMVKKVGLIELVEIGTAINSQNRNNRFRNSTVKLVVNDFEKAIALYKELGYTHEKSIKDTKKELLAAKLTGYFGETIELVTPLSKGTSEYEFLRQHGTGVYQLHFKAQQDDYIKFNEGKSDSSSMSRGYILFHKKEENEAINLTEYDLFDKKMLEKIKLREYLLPIVYFTGRRLLKLPIFEGISCNKNNYAAPRNGIEDVLAQIWKQILKTKMVGIDDDFFELGGDSLHVIQLQVNLLKHNWNLTTQDIYKYRTIRQLSDVIINIDKNGVKNATEVNSEHGFIVKDIKTKITIASEKDMEYENVLLIGATGYLGAHILNELLTGTKSNVYCLVRSKTNNDAKERLEEALKFYFGDKYTSVIDRRIFAVSGDITLEYLGLEQNEYMQLQYKIDSAIHAGALVNYYGDYSNFEEINIRGTEKVVKFCMEANKALLYISTMGISGQYLVTNKNENKINVFTENDLYIGQNYFDNPYVRSKYEAELLVNKYIKTGAKIAILRVGNLTGRFTDGHFQRNITQNAFYNIIKSIIFIGAVSKNILNEAFDFTPVDYCSRAIVKLLAREESIGRTFHLYNDNRLNVSQIIELLGDIGINIKCLDKYEFKQLIKAISSDKSSKSNLSGIVNDFDEETQLNFNTSVKLDSEITASYLKQLGFEWPSIDAEYIRKIINYMKEVKYIP